jgi:asparagine synthase (glutamine-hydrolysing)
MPEEWPSLLGAAFDGDLGRDAVESLTEVESELFAPPVDERPEATVARFETSGYLQGQLLRDIDAVSMAHGLEVRVPFVDHILQGAVWPALGRHRALLRGKQLLRMSLRETLPAVAVGRPKRGFTLPFDAWMRSGLRDATMTGIEAAVADGWVNRHAAACVVRDWQAGRAHWSRVWDLSVLGQFLRAA